MCKPQADPIPLPNPVVVAQCIVTAFELTNCSDLGYNRPLWSLNANWYSVDKPSLSCAAPSSCSMAVAPTNQEEIPELCFSGHLLVKFGSGSVLQDRSHAVGSQFFNNMALQCSLYPTTTGLPTCLVLATRNTAGGGASGHGRPAYKNTMAVQPPSSYGAMSLQC